MLKYISILSLLIVGCTSVPETVKVEIVKPPEQETAELTFTYQTDYGIYVCHKNTLSKNDFIFSNLWHQNMELKNRLSLYKAQMTVEKTIKEIK